jgi:dTDP-4-dehydrorhamnose reductase
MRIAILGAKGQLGRALERRLPLQSNDVIPLVRPEWDVADPAIVARLVALRPDALVNAAAMTNVDGCEREPDVAYQVNGLGAEHVARAAAELGIDLVHVSTDYVFDGLDGAAPYTEDAQTNPLSVYGASKLDGERRVLAVYPQAKIVRTAWLYGLGGRNFVTRMIELADERGALSVVTNEVGNPTFCDDLADAIGRLLIQDTAGIFHLANEGHASRWEFARTILAQAGRGHVPVNPIDHYPRPAKPPAFAPLANTRAAALGIRLRPWQEALTAYFEAISEQNISS